MRAVVLQPTYLPWMGYFGMIDIADTFVFYDDVQFSVQSWQQRNKIKSANGNWIWLSVPIVRKFGQNINDVRINNTTNWKKKHWASIFQSYTKAPCFEEYKEEIERIFQIEREYLSDLNISIIKKLSELLGVRIPEFMKSSEFGDITGQKTDRLLLVLEKIGADEYVSGPGAKEYINIGVFKEKGIKLYWYEFQHPVYPQIRGEFISYLSAIDLLFNTGGEAAGYIREGAKDALKLDERCLKLRN
jgi:hypothetical protein